MISLYNWDTASVISLDEINKDLSKNGNQILSNFEFSGGGGIVLPYSCRGELGQWSIGSADSVDIIAVFLPIKSGTISSPNQTLDISGLTIKLAVSLNFIAQASADLNSLIFAFDNAGRLGDSPKKNVVTPLAVSGPAAIIAALGLTGQEDLANSFVKMMVSSAKPMNYIFAQLGLPEASGTPWLAPTASIYCYASQLQGKDYLIILSVTNNQSIDEIPQYDAQILPANENNTTFAFTGNLFLKNIILPALASSFGQNLTLNDLSVNSAGDQIQLKSPFDLNPITVGLIDYVPEVTQLTGSMTDQGIILNLKGNCDLKAGIRMTFSVESRPTLNSQVKNMQLQFTADPKPISSHDASIPWYWWFAGLLVKTIVNIVVLEICTSLSNKLINNINDQSINTITMGINWFGKTSPVMSSVQVNDACTLKGIQS